MNPSQPARVWIVDDDQAIRWVLERALNAEGIVTQSFDTPTKVLDALHYSTPEVLISDIRMPGMNGLELLKAVHARQPQVATIIMTAHSDLDSAVCAYQSGAFEYLPKPFDIDEAVALVQRTRTARKQEEPDPAPTFSQARIIGEAPAMQTVFRAIGRLSRSAVTVLLNGASGTGKELVAKALHQHSPRSSKPFVALNMAAIPRDLIESELFGHEKGAFTGAGSLHTGRFEQARGGTLFLDEIGDMPADSQTRLLRVLADGEFYRVGGHVPVKADVRIIAATHQNLEKQVAQGQFREDLFHRLNVIRLTLPELNQRREDIPELARFFLAKAARELAVEAKILLPETLHHLMLLDWPGNVRQLENTCCWLTIMAVGQEVLITDLPPELQHPTSRGCGQDWERYFRQWCDQQLTNGQTAILEQAIPAMETVAITSALVHSRGRKTEASELLGWGRNTLTRKIRELAIS